MVAQELKIANLYQAFLRYLKLGSLVSLAAVLFYFWEHYLLRHYLGGFNHTGLKVQQSEPGFAFFYKTWPLWGFPLLLAIVSLVIWKQAALKRSQVNLSQLEKERFAQQRVVQELQAQWQNSQQQALALMAKNQQSKQQMGPELEEAYELLGKDYLASLEFIEKLLDLHLKTIGN